MSRYLAILLLIAACKKPEQAPPVQQRPEYTFDYSTSHWSGIVMHYRVYTTLADYRNNTNPLFTANGDTSIHFIDLPFIDSPIYYDVFTPDYRITNWPTLQYIDRQVFTVPFLELLSGNQFRGYTKYVGPLRYIMLNGDAGSTTWRAVDCCYSNDSSLWSGLTDDVRYKKITLTKDGGYTLSSAYQGDTSASSGKFALADGNDTSRIILTRLSGNAMLTVTGSTAPARDTIRYYQTLQSGVYWLMARVQ